VNVDHGVSHLAKLPTSTVYAPLGAEFEGAVLLPKRVDSRSAPADSYIVNLRNGTDARSTFEAALANAAPTAYYTNNYSELIDQANAYLAYIQLLQVGVGVGMLGLLIALLAAALRSVNERRRESIVLGILGASRRVKIHAHVLSQTLPIVICVLTAAVASAMFWLCIAAIDSGAQMTPTAYLGLLALPAGCCVVIVLITLPAALSEPPSAEKRSEARLWS
jgi:predicted lysophospholipase L1 biosynthesis ABC-type transport system permease subunit